MVYIKTLHWLPESLTWPWSIFKALPPITKLLCSSEKCPIRKCITCIFINVYNFIINWLSSVSKFWMILNVTRISIEFPWHFSSIFYYSGLRVHHLKQDWAVLACMHTYKFGISVWVLSYLISDIYYTLQLREWCTNKEPRTQLKDHPS